MSMELKSMQDETLAERFVAGLKWLGTFRGRVTFLVSVVILIVLFVVTANWRARRAWNAYRENYEKNVGPLDFQSYIPKAISDADNFAAAPGGKAVWSQKGFGRDLYYTAGDHVGNKPQKVREARHFTDLVAWEEAILAAREKTLKRDSQFATGKFDAKSRATAAPVVLEALEEDEEVFSELRAASQRTKSVYPINYIAKDPWAILLPHLASVKQACQRLGLKASAELALGQSDQALEDVKLMFYLADTVKEEPFVISFLVRVACINVALVPVWEGLKEHRWTAGQLEELEGKLESYNFLAYVQTALRAERAMWLLAIDISKERGIDYLLNYGSFGAGGGPSGNTIAILLEPLAPFLKKALSRTVPAAWYDEEKLEFCKVWDSRIEKGFDAERRRVYPQGPFPFSAGFGNEGEAIRALLKHRFLAGAVVPSLDHVAQSGAKAQTATDEAAMACALERYRMAHAKFPENLAELVPSCMKRLPQDVCSGESYKYHGNPDGSFVLYSIGWNQKDDGGQPGKMLFDPEQGDWVW